MKLPHRRQFLHLAAGAAALPVVSRIARAQAYPTRPVRIIVRSLLRAQRILPLASWANGSLSGSANNSSSRTARVRMAI